MFVYWCTDIYRRRLWYDGPRWRSLQRQCQEIYQLAGRSALMLAGRTGEHRRVMALPL